MGLFAKDHAKKYRADFSMFNTFVESCELYSGERNVVTGFVSFTVSAV